MSEITKPGAAKQTTTASIIWIGFALLVACVYFFGLTIPLLGPDEPRYAQVAREMFERGDWVTPTLGGAHWFEKPALLYWLEIAAYSLFGVSEFAARFGSVIFGLGTILCLWLLGRIVAANSSLSDLERWLVVIAASTLGIIVFSRGASFDIIVTFPLTASLTGFFAFDQAKYDSFKSKYLPLIAYYFFIGVAVLAKGLIGIIFPFAIVGFYHVLSRRMPNRTFIISLVWGTFLAVVTAGLWYWPMYHRHGYEFIDEFFVQHHFQRFTSNKYLHPQPFIFFFWVLPLMVLPWLPFLFAAIGKIAKEAFRRGSSVTPKIDTPLAFSSSPILVFSLAWLAVPLVFFSFSGSKLPGYILPAVPPAVIVTSLYLIGPLSGSRKWRRAVLIIASATLAIEVALLQFVVPKFADNDSTRTLISTAADRGYSTNPVVNLHTISHNAEFYAAGRLLRDQNGKLRRLNSAAELKPILESNQGQPILVLVPLEYLYDLLRNESLRPEILLDNGELVIAAVSLK